MSKVVAGVAMVALAGATVVGGGLLIANAGKGTQATDGEGHGNEPDSEIPQGLEEFKKKAHNEKCISGLFPRIAEIPASEPSGTSSASVGETSLTSADKHRETEGCLVVNWDRKTKKTENNVEKWSGNIRFLWAVKGEGRKGFVVFLVGKTGEKKLTWEGIAYVLTSSGDAWSWGTKKDLGATNKEFSKTVDETHFPKPGEGLTQFANQNFWDFFGSRDEMEKAATGAEDQEEVSSYRGYWEWKGGEDKALDGWTKNLGKWWEAIFTKDKWDMAKVVENKKGTWTNRVNDHKPQKPAE